jgi:hypothetical protein
MNIKKRSGRVKKLTVDEILAEGMKMEEKVSTHFNKIFMANPLVRKGLAFTPGRRQGAVGEVTRYLREGRRQGETARGLWERLKAIGYSDGHPIYFDGDEMVITRTGKSISYGAFEKRLIQRKRT